MQARRLFATAAVLIAITLGTGTSAQKGKAVEPLQMQISGGFKVLPDTIGDTYTDYRAVEGDTCVEVTVDLTFVRFNRHYPDSSAKNFVYCENVFPGEHVKRQYWLEIDNVTACVEFLGPWQPGGPDSASENGFAYWVDDDTCRVSGHDKPRIGAGDTFKAKLNTRIPVNFLILSYDGSVAYEIKTDARVTGGSTTRTLGDPGMATLIKNSTELGVKGPPPIATFAMPFQLTFTKVALAQ